MKLKEEALKLLGSEKKESIEGMGFEIIGDIAIIEANMSEEDLNKIANLIKKLHPSIGVVARKIEDVQGIYRTAKHEIIATYDRTEFLNKLPKNMRNLSSYETVHYEHGCRFMLNINEVYFSSKLGFERKRIAEQVKEGEKIAVLFAGVGPFAIVIAKHKPVEIDAVEINEKAVEYFYRNIQLNKLKGKIAIHHEDVGKWIKNNSIEKYSRIIMPAPKDAPTYLEEVLYKASNNAIIHHYFFVKKEDIPNIREEIEEKYGVKVLYERVAGSVGTNTFRYVVDMKKII